MKLANQEKEYPIGIDGMLRPTEAAERFGVSINTIIRWADAGLIRRSRINRRMSLYCVRSIQEFLARHETT